LAIIMRTVISGCTDLLHLSLVIILVLTSFTLSGHILLGPRMEEMSSVKGAWGYCLQIVFQREYNWDRMTQEGMLVMTLWIVSFVLLLIVVLINLVLAMIFDHYGEVRSTVAKEETIWRFFIRMVTQLRLQSVWVSNTTLLVKLSQLPQEELVTPNTLRRILPGISQEQIDHVFGTAAQKQMMRHSTQGHGHLAKVVAGLLISVVNTRRAVKKMANGMASETPADRRTSCRSTKKLYIEDEDAVVADEVRPEDISLAGPGGEAPEELPDWMQAGLLKSLRAQRKAMREMHVHMEDIQDSLSQRGIKNEPAPWSRGAPPMPSLAFLQGDDDEVSLPQPAGQQASTPQRRAPRMAAAKGPRRSPRSSASPWTEFFSI